MKHLLILIDVFFMLRPLLLIPVWGFCIFGYYHGTMQSSVAPIVPLWNLHTLTLFLWFVIFSISVAAVHIINQLADIDVDRANSGLPLLAKGKVPVSYARISAFICASIGIVAPLFKHPFLSICSCAALAIGLTYSLRPVRLSGRFVFDFLANATGYGIVAFGAGWYLSKAPLTVVPFTLSALPYFLLMCSGSISSTIPDYHGDKRYGKNTTAVILGVKKAHLLAAIFLCFAAMAALLTHNTIALICSLCAIPIYGLYFISHSPRLQEATYKGGGFLCMAMASVLMPVFGIVAIIVALLTVMYFRKRHHITYPSLVPASYEE